MIHIVRSGESLWRISEHYYGDGRKCLEIARDNGIINPDHILVGAQIRLRDAQIVRRQNQANLGLQHHSQMLSQPGAGTKPSLIPVNNYLFILADEINPLSRKVVRRVLVSQKMAAEAAKNLGKPLSLFPHPERFGFQATSPNSALSIGRHAMGLKPSPFMSASKAMLGAQRFSGTPFWIDVAKAKQAGATLHETTEIIADLNRISAKSNSPTAKAKIAEIQKLVNLDREVLLKGNVAPSAIKGPASMALTRGLQGVQIIGFAMTAIDLKNATNKSLAQNSVKPIAAETVRQAGGWASAWAGMKIGAAGGALVGIETGPGALVTGFVGGVAGGVAGYFAFDWIADHIDNN